MSPSRHPRGTGGTFHLARKKREAFTAWTTARLLTMLRPNTATRGGREPHDFSQPASARARMMRRFILVLAEAE